jgi:Ca2+/Na+ antiporter
MLVVLMDKELVVLLPGTPFHLLVVVGARPLQSASMRRRLRRVVLQLMLLLLLLLLLLWDLRLPGLARAELLVFVLVLVGTNMWLVVGPLL